MDIRRAAGIHCRSVVKVRKATGDVYAATVDDKIAMKIGRGDWSPNSARLDVGQKKWEIASSGQGFAVWNAVF
jgi:alpha-amylase